jgi:hypothetical protein
MEDLKVLSNDELRALANKIHIEITRDIDTDERSLYDSRKFMSTMLNIGTLIQLLIDGNYSYSMAYDRGRSKSRLTVENVNYERDDICDCLWAAVKHFIMRVE